MNVNVSKVNAKIKIIEESTWKIILELFSACANVDSLYFARLNIFTFIEDQWS